MTETLKIFRVFASVFETMQMNFNATFRQRLYSKENVNNAAVIGRIWNVETDDMQMSIRYIAHKFLSMFVLHFPNTNPVLLC